MRDQNSERSTQGYDPNSQSVLQSTMAAVTAAPPKCTSKDNDTSIGYLQWMASKMYKLNEDEKVLISPSSFRWGNPQRAYKTQHEYQPRTLKTFNIDCVRFNHDIPSTLGTDTKSAKEQVDILQV